jgi:hypothetical protein
MAPGDASWLPEDYIAPSQFAVSIRRRFDISDKRDRAAFTRTLLSIGSSSEDEIDAREGVLCGVGCAALARSRTASWESCQCTLGPLMMPPTQITVAGDHINPDDPFARRTKVAEHASEESPSSFSSWVGMDFGGEMQIEPRVFGNLRIELPRLMTTLQMYFHSCGYEWFHPTDMVLIARSPCQDLLVKLTAEFTDVGVIQLTVGCVEGS